MDKNNVSRRAFSLGLGGSAICLPFGSFAQADWPTRAVRIIAPAPPGGSLDRLARTLSDEYAKAMGQPFVVENRAGAGSTIGTAAVAAAPADGYTLLMSGVFNTISPSLYAKLPYDYLKDFIHVAPTAAGSNVLVVRPEFPANNLAELIREAKAKPDTLSYASAGSGTSGHLTMELFQRAAGIKLMHVPYKGSAPAMTDVLGGVTPMIATNQDAVLPFLKTGKLKALGITTAHRIPAFADVQTFVEAGFTDLVVSSWGAVAARRGTPVAIAERLRTTTYRVLRQPNVRKPLEADGWELMAMGQADFEAFARKETERWSEVIKAANIHLG
ncbi:tripartite-type tricarboxylate transporter receptor subunit TctC [Variovorax paradoxus]|uniref:Bug family tripartite tricarboxylate transporter substrate binding protein n=1 Tax=Variovorax paradoxus TaxID=34073 RepID=UPI002783D146|nr:tripartite tricarboxylate transporter substrate binding protein [Variovorax paradoxus]MDP9962895.1 tripartite-type tricarboxylate transporter receptor subunit TctC [Variovorax paradoxus]